MEHPPGLALLKILARGRQWESEVSILWCYLRQNTCKSDQSQVFFAGVGKIFFMLRKSLVDPVPTLVLYAQSLAMSRTIWARPGIKFAKSARRL